jgi:hypothetical protein
VGLLSINQEVMDKDVDVDKQNCVHSMVKSIHILLFTSRSIYWAMLRKSSLRYDKSYDTCRSGNV